MHAEQASMYREGRGGGGEARGGEGKGGGSNLEVISGSIITSRHVDKTNPICIMYHKFQN